jgi:hypothetical protein
MSEKDRDEGCTLDRVQAVKSEAQSTFGRLAQVAGIGITRFGNGYGLKVNLERAPSAEVRLPNKISGVPVRIEIIGTIRKRATT